MVSDQTTDDSYAERGTPFWLPPTGFGNGLRSVAWAWIIDLPDRLTQSVLLALTDAGIPAYVDRLRSRTPELDTVDLHVTYRLWVDSHRYSAAEDVLMTLLRADQKKPWTKSTRNTHQPLAECVATGDFGDVDTLSPWTHGKQSYIDGVMVLFGS